MGLSALTGFSDAFDELLAGNRKALDDHLTSPSSPTPSSAFDALLGRTRTATAQHPASGASVKVEQFPAVAPAESTRFLNARFGELGWTYEILERRREEDEVIVLCRLSVPDRNISKTQFGRASLLPAPANPEIQGTADGIHFSIANEPSSSRHPGALSEERTEAQVYREAVADALSRCARMF